MTAGEVNGIKLLIWKAHVIASKKKKTKQNWCTKTSEEKIEFQSPQ